MDQELLSILKKLPGKNELYKTENCRIGAQYIRVSTDDQTELSPITQLKLGLEYAQTHNILIPYEFVFVETGGVSGRKVKNRHEFNKMITLSKLKEHNFDLILVWKFSRFARNQEESIVYKSLLAKNNIDVISITEPIDDSPFGKLNERIIEWMDEYYSINLSGEVVRGMKEKALRGGYQAACPLGYDYVGKNLPPKINPEEKIIIQKIFGMYLDGSSLTQIAIRLNELGYHSKRNGLFENRTIRYILQNPFYIGKIRWNYYDRSSLSYNDSEEVIISDGSHEAIIPLETWNLVQSILKKRMKPYKKRDISACKHWLSGILHCSNCGKTLAYVNQRRPNYEYIAFKCWGYTKGMCTISNNIRLSESEGCIIEGLVNIIKTRKLYNFTIHEKNDTKNELEEIESLLHKLDLKEVRFRNSYAAGIDTLAEYKENKQNIKFEREKLETKRLNMTSQKNSSALNKKKILGNIESTYNVLTSENNFVEKGNAIRSIVEKVVYDKETYSFQFYFYIIN